MRRLYTRRGDLGETDLLGERVAKDDPRIDLIGELDETTSVLGLARSVSKSERGNQILIDIQRDLYRVMADLAFVTDTRPPGYETSAEWVERIETADRSTDGRGRAAAAIRAAGRDTSQRRAGCRPRRCPPGRAAGGPPLPDEGDHERARRRLPEPALVTALRAGAVCRS